MFALGFFFSTREYGTKCKVAAQDPVERRTMAKKTVGYSYKNQK
jgi:hypothetical protein